MMVILMASATDGISIIPPTPESLGSISNKLSNMEYGGAWNRYAYNSALHLCHLQDT